MVKSQTERQLEIVSDHIDQTHLVNELLQQLVLDAEDIEWWHADEYDDLPDIYQWKVFSSFMEYDYEKLIAANIPVLSTIYGTWVGLTSYGSPYDMYVYPQLMSVLFGGGDSSKEKTACLEAAV